MISPKRVIPPLAVAMLPLTGTGCGDSGTSQLTSALDGFCEFLAGCYTDYNLEACIDAVPGYVEEASEYYSDACLKAVASYINCFSALTCEEYMDYDSEGFQACLALGDEEVGPACDPQDD